MKKILLYIIFTFCCYEIFGQYFMPLNPFYDINTGLNSLYPLTFNDKLALKDSLLFSKLYTNPADKKNWLVRKMFYEPFIKVREKNFEFNFNPMVEFEFGKEYDNKIYRNTRGFYLESVIGDKIGFYSSFFENQSRFMKHVSEYADYYGIIPGQGFHKSINESDYDFAWSEGMLIFFPAGNWNIQFGHGKRFVGNGYRSMLYSDNAFSYLNLFFSYSKNKIQYSSWFTSFINPDQPYPVIIHNHRWIRKAGCFHYLSYSASKNLQVSLFEGSIIQSLDNEGRYKFGLNQYNPVILINQFDKQLNSYLGFNVNISLLDFMLYGQYIINSSDINKMGGQTGLKYYKSISGLSFKVSGEINYASKGLYSFSDSTLSYSHYNQPLSHPLGDNFTEVVFKTTIRFKSIELDYKINLSENYSDSAGYNPSLNIFYPDDSQVVMNDQSHSTINEIKISYIFNPHLNMRISLGFFNRSYKELSKKEDSNYYYISFSTDIFRKYYDF